MRGLGALAILAVLIQTAPANAADDLPLVTVVTTGGTIAQKADLKTGAFLSRELRGPKARLLLMLALPQVKDAAGLARLFD